MWKRLPPCRRGMGLSRFKVSVSYLLKAVGDLEKNFQVGANTDPRESPGSQSGPRDRQVAGDRRQLLPRTWTIGCDPSSGTASLPAGLKFQICLLPAGDFGLFFDPTCLHLYNGVIVIIYQGIQED